MQTIKLLLIVSVFSIANCAAQSPQNKVKNIAKIDTNCQTHAVKDQFSDNTGTRFVLVGCGKRLVYYCEHGKFGPYGFEQKCEKIQ